MNEELNVEKTSEVIIYENNNTNIYEIANNIHTMLSVLTFTIMIIFLYKYLKNNFGFRK